MKKLAFVVAAVSLLAFAALAYGERGGQRPGSGMLYGCGMDGTMMDAEHHMTKMMKGLNLDEQQKTSMREIKSRMMKETITKKADLQIAHIELRDLLTQDTVDMKAIEAKVRQLEAMKADMQLSHIKAMEECKTKLTPEQRKKMREMMEAAPMMGMKHDQERGMKGKRSGAKRHQKKERAE